MPDADALRAAALEVIAQARPGVQKDGGDLELVEIRGDRVFIRLSGACVACAFAGQTLGGIRRRLMQKVGWPIRVVPAP